MKRTAQRFILFALVMLTFSCESGSENSNDKVDVQFGFENKTVSRSKAVDKTATAIVITIKQGASTVHSSLEMPVTNFNGNIITEPLPLLVGNYEITEYKVKNAANEVIYATPADGSTAALLVDDALDISFTVSKDVTNIVRPEVLDTEAFTPEDFGYPSFGFTIVPTFHFNMVVQRYDNTQQKYVNSKAYVRVWSDSHIDFNDSIPAGTATIEIRDNKTNYTIEISEPGYETLSYGYDLATMKSFVNLPFQHILKVAPLYNWAGAYIDNGSDFGGWGTITLNENGTLVVRGETINTATYNDVTKELSWTRATGITSDATVTLSIDGSGQKVFNGFGTEGSNGAISLKYKKQ